VYDDLISQLEQTPVQIEAIVSGLPEEAWTRVPPGQEGEEGWTLETLARHLRDIELDAFQFRIEQILAQRPPEWERRFSGHLAAERGGNGSATLAEFARARAETVARLRSLTPEQWALATEHPRRGPLDIAFFARAFIEHDQEHVRQAQELVERLSTSP
jgi:hypothetical protein